MADPTESSRPTVLDETDSSSNIFNSEIGDDWGEAFQADDFLISPEEDTNSDFFLDEEDFSEPTAAGVQQHKEESDKGKPETTNSSSFPLSILSTLRRRFQTLPKVVFYPALATSLLVLLFLASLLVRQPQDETDSPLTEVKKVEEQAPLVNNKELVETSAAQEPEKKVVEQPVRKKWDFPAFLISTSDEMKGDDIFFVEVDLTLVLLLKAGDKIPTDKQIFVRDIIYQFFNNRPLYELRRYSLARGEMQRKLKAWLEKSWPDTTISSIFFNRYQVL